MDYNELNRLTVKETLMNKSAFYYNNFPMYDGSGEQMRYGQDNFIAFRKMVCKYFTKSEWQDIVAKRYKEEFTDYEFKSSEGGI